MDDLAIALSAYKGKRIFITGDTGFKGSWLSFWLNELGADVVGYALPPERDMDHFNLIHLERFIHHINGDIRDLDTVQKILEEFQPEILFHLAAQALVRKSYQEPKETFDININGSVNILEGVRLTPSVHVLIYVTSDKCYKNNEWIWGYRENDELGGKDPYSASKAAAELVFSSYWNSYFQERKDFGAASVRAGNVIGGGDWSADRIVPDCIRSLQNDISIILRNPSSTRPWQHVLEPLSGYLLLGAKLLRYPKQYSGSWNFGPDSGSVRTVQDLTERITSCWGSGIVQKINNENLHEAQLLCLNCDKAHHLLNWYPRWNFEHSVRETVKWYKKVSTHVSAIDITKQQIHDFMEDSYD